MSDSVIQGVVSHIDSKPITSKKTGKAMTIYEIYLTDQSRWSTVNTETANAAKSLVGQHATLHVRIEQNGDFVNQYLQGIGPSNGGTVPVQTDQLVGSHVPQPQTIAAPPAMITTQTPNILPQSVATPTPDWAMEQQERKNEAIHRQTATKVAAWLAKPDSTPQEFWANVDDLIQFYTSGIKPNLQANANGFQGVPAGVDDDIPF